MGVGEDACACDWECGVELATTEETAVPFELTVALALAFPVAALVLFPFPLPVVLIRQTFCPPSDCLFFTFLFPSTLVPLLPNSTA